jgi:hypothetical protein
VSKFTRSERPGVPHHRAHFRCAGSRRVCRRRRPGRGCAAGDRRRRPRASLRSPARVPATEEVQICELRRAPARARAASPKRLAGRIDRASCAAARRLLAARPRRARRSSATYGRTRAGCCTWTSGASRASRRPGTRSPATARSAREGSADIACTRRSITPGRAVGDVGEVALERAASVSGCLAFERGYGRGIPWQRGGGAAGRWRSGRGRR